MRRKDEQERFRLPFFSLGGVALLSGLDRDTVFQLAQKGVLNPEWNSEAKMIFKRNEVARWIREASR